jgi:hypothetical protein
VGSILILNMIGGSVLVALLAVDGSLPAGTAETLVHIAEEIWESGTVGYGDLWRNVSLAAAGNVAGGLLLITLTHTAQTKGRR